MQLKKRLHTYKNVIGDLISNTPEQKLVVFAMLISVIFWSSISGYLKIERYYKDEWIYLQTAYSIKNGYGLNAIYGIEGLVGEHGRYVYSLLIAPACLIENIGLRLKAIALINAISLSSSAIPVYFLANEMLKNRRTRMLVVIIALTMPYMNYCACFMSENVLIPIGLWLVYLNYRLINFCENSLKKNLCYIFGTIVFTILAWYTKASGRVFLFMGMVTAFLAIGYSKKDKIFKQPIRLLLISISVILMLAILFFAIISYAGNNIVIDNIRVAFEERMLLLENINSIYWDSILHVFISFVLAFCIIPIVYYWNSIKYSSVSGKLLSVWLFVISVLCVSEVVRLSFERYNQVFYQFNEGFSQVHFRYITFLYIPFIILFFGTIENRNGCTLNAGIKLAAEMIAFFIVIILFYRGAQFEHAPAYTSLYWVRSTVDVHSAKLVFSLIIACIIAAFIFIYVNYPQKIVVLFLVIWVPIQIYNNVMFHSALVEENALEDERIFELRGFVLEHMQDEFLLIDKDYVRNDAECLWAGDTYLDTRNIIRYDPNLMNYATFPCDLNAFYEMYYPSIDVSKVKYIILKSGLEPIDSTEVSLVDGKNCKWYTLYELKNLGELPVIIEGK